MCVCCGLLQFLLLLLLLLCRFWYFLPRIKYDTSVSVPFSLVSPRRIAGRKQIIPADPANPDSREVIQAQAGQVRFVHFNAPHRSASRCIEKPPASCCPRCPRCICTGMFFFPFLQCWMPVVLLYSYLYLSTGRCLRCK